MGKSKPASEGGSGKDAHQELRAKEQEGAQESQTQEAASSDEKVAVKINPKLSGYGVTSVRLSTGEVVESGRKAVEVSKAGYDAGDKDSTGKYQLVVKA